MGQPGVLLRMTSYFPCDWDGSDPATYVTEVNYSLMDADTGEVFGKIDVYDITGLDYEPGPERDSDMSFEIMDCHSAELASLHSTIEAWCEKTKRAEPVDAVLHIADFSILPAHRGRGIGTQALDGLLERWSHRYPNGTLVTVHAVPTHDEWDLAEWQQQDAGGYQAAQLRLMRFYERFGFRLAPDSEFMMRHLSYQKGRTPGLLSVQ